MLLKHLFEARETFGKIKVGDKYLYWSEEEVEPEENIKLSHYITDQSTGDTVKPDWSPYTNMTERDVVLYMTLVNNGGVPNRREIGSNAPLDTTDLEKIFVARGITRDNLNEDLKKWFREKWVRFGPDGKIRGDCARGSDSEGKPKCLPQSKAHSLGRKGRASAAARKRREDPNPERTGKAINVATKKTNEEYQQCPECGGNMYEVSLMNEKKDACYYKVKSRYKVWPSAYASGALVRCRKKGSKNWGNKS